MILASRGISHSIIHKKLHTIPDGLGPQAHSGGPGGAVGSAPLKASYKVKTQQVKWASERET
jgi:hypothetical protein